MSDLGLTQASDLAIWEEARTKNYCIVTKDSDFLHIALLYGAPPKIIIVRTGNATTADIEHCLLTHRNDINAFLANDHESVLVVP